MSSGLVYEKVHDNLRKLNLSVIETTLDNYLELANKNKKPVMDILDHLLTQEVTKRETSKRETLTKLAGFPVKKHLSDFDLEFQPSIDKEVYNEIRTLRFLHNNENVILLGPSGVGKTHLAIGLGMEVIKAGLSVYYQNSMTLVERLKMANRKGSLERKLKRLNKYALVIVDEIGYLPFDREGSHLFFQFIHQRYERGATIFTSNKPYSEWGEILGDNVIAAAVLDRILHHSITVNIKGDSYRLKDRMNRGVDFLKRKGGE